jgi:hypothetical protein
MTSTVNESSAWRMVTHDWLLENIGYDNYNWTGGIYWFNNEQDALWFVLSCPKNPEQTT